VRRVKCGGLSADWRERVGGLISDFEGFSSGDSAPGGQIREGFQRMLCYRHADSQAGRRKWGRRRAATFGRWSFVGKVEEKGVSTCGREVASGECAATGGRGEAGSPDLRSGVADLGRISSDRRSGDGFSGVLLRRRVRGQCLREQFRAREVL
jgi:hypothetical protein